VRWRDIAMRRRRRRRRRAIPKTEKISRAARALQGPKARGSEDPIPVRAYPERWRRPRGFGDAHSARASARQCACRQRAEREERKEDEAPLASFPPRPPLATAWHRVTPRARARLPDAAKVPRSEVGVGAGEARDGRCGTIDCTWIRRRERASEGTHSRFASPFSARWGASPQR